MTVRIQGLYKLSYEMKGKTCWS